VHLRARPDPLPAGCMVAAAQLQDRAAGATGLQGGGEFTAHHRNLRMALSALAGNFLSFQVAER